MDDHAYTLDKLVSQLGLMEEHINDGSWRECSCNPEKHLPLIMGYAAEGHRFATSDAERRFMDVLRDKAQYLKPLVKLSKDSSFMENVADWARLTRHQIEERQWIAIITLPTKEFFKNPNIMFETSSLEKSCPTCNTDSLIVPKDIESIFNRTSDIVFLLIPLIPIGAWLIGNMLQTTEKGV